MILTWLDEVREVLAVRRVSPGDGQSAAYHAGKLDPNYPVPVIPLSVHWPDTGYHGAVYIDDDRFEGDPQMVYMYDHLDDRQVIFKDGLIVCEVEDA